MKKTIFLLAGLMIGTFSLSSCIEKSVDRVMNEIPLPTATEAPVVSASPDNTEEPSGTIEITNEMMFGYWRSTKDFASEEYSTYYFFDDGGFDFNSTSDGNQYGSWDLKDGKNIGFSYQDADRNLKKPEYVDIKLRIATEDNSKIISIDGVDYWKMNRPTDIIKGKPFYIEYDFVYDMKNEGKTRIIQPVSERNEFAENLVFSFAEDLYDFSVYRIDYENENENFEFTVADLILNLDMLPKEYVLDYSTTTPEGIPFEAVTFKDSNGERYSYIWGYNGRGGDFIPAGSLELDVPDVYFTGTGSWHEDEVIEIDGQKQIVSERDGVSGNFNVYYKNPKAGGLQPLYSGDSPTSKPMLSPDGTKIAYIAPYEFETYGDVYIHDVLKNETISFSPKDLTQFEANLDVWWLDDQYLLFSVGFGDGTVTRGGNKIYSYTVQTGEIKLIMKTLIEIEDIQIDENGVKLSMCAVFNNANNYLRYFKDFSKDHFYMLMLNNEVYEMEDLPIEKN